MLGLGLTVDELTMSPPVGGLVLRTFAALLQAGLRMAPAEMAAASGTAEEAVRRLRRAFGLPEPGPGEHCFVAADVEVLRFVHSLTDLVGPDLAMHFARTLGTAMSRVAEAEVSLLRS